MGLNPGIFCLSVGLSWANIRQQHEITSGHHVLKWKTTILNMLNDHQWLKKVSLQTTVKLWQNMLHRICNWILSENWYNILASTHTFVNLPGLEKQKEATFYSRKPVLLGCHVQPPYLFWRRKIPPAVTTSERYCANKTRNNNRTEWMG